MKLFDQLLWPKSVLAALLLAALGGAAHAAPGQHDYLGMFSRLTAPEALQEAPAEGMPARFAQSLLLLHNVQAEGLDPDEALAAAFIRNAMDPSRRDLYTAHYLEQYQIARENGLLPEDAGARVNLKVRTILPPEDYPQAARELVNYAVALPGISLSTEDLTALRKVTLTRVHLLPSLEQVVLASAERRERRLAQAERVAVAEAAQPRPPEQQEPPQPVVVNNIIQAAPPEPERVIYRDYSPVWPAVYPRPGWHHRPCPPVAPVSRPTEHRRVINYRTGEVLEDNWAEDSPDHDGSRHVIR